MRIFNASISFYRAIYSYDKWRILPCAMSTSAVRQNKEPNVDFVTLKHEFLKEYKKSYEDTFGNIGTFEKIFQRVTDDPEDILEYQKAKAAKGKTTIQYIKEIKSLLSNNDYKSAKNLLEIDMVNDKISLNKLVYKILINYNAKLGNLKEAYRLFLDYKKRQGIVTGAIYTSMFNACANCKNSFFAIEKANAVRECMSNNKFHSVNISNYNAMIKAYGRHGDFSTCMKIMDEVIEKRDKVRSDTYVFLLQACISDKNSGLRHALLVWRKMIQNKIKPSIFSFNLMLRCVRDCSLGDTLLLHDFIEQIKEESMVFYKKKVKIVTIGDKKQREILKIPTDSSNMIKPVENALFESQEKCDKNFTKLNEPNYLSLEENSISSESLHMDSSAIENSENVLELSKKDDESYYSAGGSDLNSDSSLDKIAEDENNGDVSVSSSAFDLPNLLALKPTTGSVINFGVTTEPHYRLVLVGGLKGFLKTMAEFGVEPNSKTFTLLLSCIPSTLQAEEELMSVMERYKIEFDTAFFNVLIKRKIFRDEEFSLKDCLRKMYTLNLKPDILTFGILAMSCTTRDSGMKLLEVLHDHGFRANSEILHPLLKQAFFARDLNYVRDVLKAAKEDEVELKPNFLALLSKIVKKEKRLRSIEKNAAENISVENKLEQES